MKISIKNIIIIVLLAYVIVSTYVVFELGNAYKETFNYMSLELNKTERKLNKTEQFWYDCREKEIEWGGQLIKLGNFTPIKNECSFFCDFYNLSRFITRNTAEDKYHDLETDLEHLIKRRSLYIDDYLCLCVS